MLHFDGLFVSNGSLFTEHKSGPNTEPCGTPLLTFGGLNLVVSSLMQEIQTTCVPAHKEVLALVSHLIQPIAAARLEGAPPQRKHPVMKAVRHPGTAYCCIPAFPTESC